MALPLLNTLDGGTDNVDISPANSGGASGNAFDAITKGAGAVLRYDNSQSMFGGTSMEFASDSGASESAFVQWRESTDGLQSTMYASCFFRTSAWPGGNASIMSALSTTTSRWRLQLTTAGKIRVIDAASAAVTTSTMSVDVDDWWRIEAWAFLSATVGDCITRIYHRNSNVIAEENQAASATVNFGGTANTYRFGCVANQTAFHQSWMDHLQVNRTGWPGPFPITPQPARRSLQAVARRATI